MINMLERECPICLDKYTGNSIRALRKKITCLKCSFSACKTFLKQVLLTNRQKSTNHQQTPILNMLFQGISYRGLF